MNLSRCPAVVLIVFLLAACAACSEARLPSGSWNSRRAVAQDFEQARVFPDHTYYYIGSVSQPDGVIAIDQRFRLREGGTVFHHLVPDADHIRQVGRLIGSDVHD